MAFFERQQRVAALQVVAGIRNLSDRGVRVHDDYGHATFILPPGTHAADDLRLPLGPVFLRRVFDLADGGEHIADLHTLGRALIEVNVVALSERNLVVRAFAGDHVGVTRDILIRDRAAAVEILRARARGARLGHRGSAVEAEKQSGKDKCPTHDAHSFGNPGATARAQRRYIPNGATVIGVLGRVNATFRDVFVSGTAWWNPCPACTIGQVWPVSPASPAFLFRHDFTLEDMCGGRRCGR
jgi:hypothetical protein